MPADFDFHLPPGRWAIGVSGGADSVALARLAAAAAAKIEPNTQRLVLAHLDHQLRYAESDGDAAFVAALGRSLGVPTEIGHRDAIEQAMPKLAANPSARYRAARLAFFAEVVQRHGLDGVLLAHHADDQAETVLLQMRRGRGLPFIGGIRAVQTIEGVVIRRPLLSIRREALRIYLISIDQAWREDSSNASPKYGRNVLRQWLMTKSGCVSGWHGLVPQAVSSPAPHKDTAWEYQTVPPGNDIADLIATLHRIADHSSRLRERLDADSPHLGESFSCDALRGNPLLAEHAARRWLVARGAPADRVSPAVCQRLIAQATDVTRPPRQHYPGRLLVRRRAKQIDVIGPAGSMGVDAAPSLPLQSPSTHGQETHTPAEL